MKKHFITGLAILLPLLVTVFLVAFIVNFLTRPFLGVTETILSGLNIPDFGVLPISREQLIRYISQIIILVLLFGFTVLLGVLGRWFFIHQLLSLGDFILHKIPVVNKVYKTSQEVIKTIFTSQQRSFKQVVLVPYPTACSHALALLAKDSPEECRGKSGEELISVFLPTTPNPTSGFLLMFPKEDVIFLDMKVEDAVKFIISCGVILPEDNQGNGEPQLEEKGEE